MMDVSYGGYDKSRFVSDIILDHLICSICIGVFRDPVSCNSCDNKYCRTCISKHFSELGNTCPHCRNSLSANTISAARTIANIVGSLKITCDFAYNGCKGIISLEDLPGHTKKCPYSSKEIHKRRSSILLYGGCDDTYSWRNKCSLLLWETGTCYPVVPTIHTYQYPGIHYFNNAIYVHGKRLNDHRGIVGTEVMRFTGIENKRGRYNCHNNTKFSYVKLLCGNTKKVLGWELYGRDTIVANGCGCARMSVLMGNHIISFCMCDGKSISNVHIVCLLSVCTQCASVVDPILKMPSEGLRGSCIVPVGDDIFVFGGTFSYGSDDDNNYRIFPSDTIMKLNHAGDGFTFLAELPEPTYNMASVTYEKYVFLMGGIRSDNVVTKSVIRFDTEEKTVLKLPDMNDARHSCSAVVFDNNSILVTGGIANTEIPRKHVTSSEILRIDKSKAGWEKIPLGEVRRNNHIMSVIPGNVL